MGRNGRRCKSDGVGMGVWGCLKGISEETIVSGCDRKVDGVGEEGEEGGREG